ncbi:TPA: hypothetical protein ACPOJ4_001103 [Haemophilus influenzae]
MMTHKITLPDGTIIEIFTNADEVGQTDLDIQALWREAEQKAQRKMKLDEHIKHKSIQRKKKAAHTKNRQDGNNARGKYGKASRNHRIFIK